MTGQSGLDMWSPRVGQMRCGLLLEQSPEAVLHMLAELADAHREYAQIISLKRLEQIEYRQFLAEG